MLQMRTLLIVTISRAVLTEIHTFKNFNPEATDLRMWFINLLLSESERKLHFSTKKSRLALIVKDVVTHIFKKIKFEKLEEQYDFFSFSFFTVKNVSCDKC